MLAEIILTSIEPRSPGRYGGYGEYCMLLLSRKTVSNLISILSIIGVPHEVDSYHTLVPLEPIDSIANQQVGKSQLHDSLHC